MKLTNCEWWRARRLGTLCWIVAGLLGTTLALATFAQGISTTTVQGTVYLANGQPGGGTLVVSWPSFTTATGQAVTSDRLTVTIPADGFVSVNLAPNVGALPAGLYYTAVFYMSDGTVNTQYWQVPAAAQASLAQIQTQVMPAAQAVQAVSKSYVDQAIEELEQSLLQATGGTLTGPLILNGDPTQPLQAATKHYVDTQVSTAVPLAGGNMTGALGTPAVNGVESPTVGSSQTTLQAAMNAAGTHGAMEIPPTYAGTDTFTNPNGVMVTDLRTNVAQQRERSVKEFGAVCDGVTDDTNALQAALNYARAHSVALTIPEGTCKTQTLNWHGESIGGLGKQVSALKGFPGQDVLASTADSLGLLSYTRLHDLTIYVDQSVDASCTAAEGRAAAGSCQMSRPLEVNSIFSSGGNGLTGTSGSGAAWQVGNCAIAMPAATGSGGNGLKVAEIENLEIATTGVDPMAAQYPGAHSTHTCGMYLAQWPQWSEFRNIDIVGLNTGIAIPALPVTTPTGLNADSNRWQNVTIQATHAFTAAAGSNNVLDSLVAVAGNSSATSEPPTGVVLDFAGTQQGWTVRNAVILPMWIAVQPALTVTTAGGAVTAVAVGTEHGLGWDPYGTSVPVAFSGSCTAQATATVNTAGAISAVTVTQGGVGCSATTTASVNAAGTWDTAAPVNLISGREITIFAGNLLKGNGGYTVWTAQSSSNVGTQLSGGGGGTLPGGGSYPAVVASASLGSMLEADQFPGADFGAKLQSCLAAVNLTSGGTCDARNFTGTQAMAANLLISTSNTAILLPCATIATANQIIISAGTRNVSLHGCSLRGGTSASGSQGGTAFAYSGSGAMVQVGDPNYATDTPGFRLDNVVINTTGATSASAEGFIAYRTQELHLESLYFLGNPNQTAVTLDGTGNYTGGTFLDNQISGFQTAINAIGHQVPNSSTTDWLNASTFVRVHIDCPTSSGNPVSGTVGINLAQGDGNTFSGGDVEGCSTALHLGPNAQSNTFVGLRNENSTNQVVADVGSSYNSWMSGGTIFTGQLTDNGTRNSFLDTFHRSFNGINGDWYGSQQDATVTNHWRLGTGTGNERGLLNQIQTDYGYRWNYGFSDGTSGVQLYQINDLLNNVPRISVGQYLSATANIVTNVMLNNSGCYTSSTPPTIGFSGGGGSGATATATMYAITSGTTCAGGYGVSSVTMTNNGSGYTSQPSLTWSGSNQLSAPNAVAEITLAGSTNNQTVINSAGTGAVVLNGSKNSGTGGVVFGSGGATETTVASVDKSGDAQFNGTLLVGSTTQSTGTMTVRNNADSEVDYYLWPGLTTSQKGSYTYKDWNGNSQWYLVKDASNNWAVNSAIGGLDSFKAYQSTNSGDTYVNASNTAGHIRLNYESGSGAETDIYSGSSSSLDAAFLGPTSIKFPGLAAGSGHYCLQVDTSGYITNTGAACGSGSGSGSGSGTVNSGNVGQIAFYTANGTVVGGENTVPITAGGTGQATVNGGMTALGMTQTGTSGSTTQSDILPGNFWAWKMGGFSYASQWQSGAGNNGIANAASSATNQIVIADPSYATTEAPGPYSFAANGLLFSDRRAGTNLDFFHNPTGLLSPWNNLYPSIEAQAASTEVATFDGLSAGSNAGLGGTYYSAGVHNKILNVTSPGWSLGNPPLASSGAGWYVSGNTTLDSINNNAGIAESLTINQYKYGVGDNAAAYLYLWKVHGGWTAPSDEGTKPLAIEVVEDPNTYTGTVTGGAATGSTLIHTSAVNDAGSQGVGQYLIDTSAGACAGKFTSISNWNVGSAISVTGVTGCTITESVAWGTVTANVSTPLNSTTSPFSTSETFTVTIAGGTSGSGGQFDTTHLACWANTYHDCAVPTAVGPVSGGTQSITMPLRRPHVSGSYLFQGGMTGYGIEATNYTESPNGQPLRYLFDVVGAISSTTLIAVDWERGSAIQVLIPANSYQTFNVCSGATNGGVGTTITGTWCGGTLGGSQPWQYAGNNFVLAGLSDSALNTTCTNVVWLNTYPGNFTCTITGLTGSHTDTTGGTASLGINSFNLWPMAEILDVQNEALSPPQVDGTFALEPNIIPFANGDTVENPHHASAEFQGETDFITTTNPYEYTNGINIVLGGPGVQGGGYSTSSNAVISATNNQPDSYYTGNGGTQIPMNVLNYSGAYNYGIDFNEGPVIGQGQAVINIAVTPNQYNNPNYCFNLWQIYNQSSSNAVVECPKSGNVSFVNSSSTGTYTYQAASHQFKGVVNAVNGLQVNGSALASGNLADWTNTGAANGYLPIWNSSTGKWTATAAPTWNQNTTGNAATATSASQVNGGSIPTSATQLATNSSGQIVAGANTLGCLDGYNHLPCTVYVESNVSESAATASFSTLWTTSSAGVYRVAGYIYGTTASSTPYTVGNYVRAVQSGQAVGSVFLVGSAQVGTSISSGSANSYVFPLAANIPVQVESATASGTNTGGTWSRGIVIERLQ